MMCRLILEAGLPCVVTLPDVVVHFVRHLRVVAGLPCVITFADLVCILCVITAGRRWPSAARRRSVVVNLLN